jgi:hypothetical protein
MFFRLDKVLGTSKSLDSYESGPSLASRICKIEKQVRIELDMLNSESTNLILKKINRLYLFYL